MYDFYKNPPKTREDIRGYLTSWLEKVPAAETIVAQGDTFVQELGFRRGFYNHCVYRSLSTGQYVWWVFEEPDLETFPTKRFPSYEALLEDVVEFYLKLWKL